MKVITDRFYDAFLYDNLAELVMVSFSNTNFPTLLLPFVTELRNLRTSTPK